MKKILFTISAIVAGSFAYGQTPSISVNLGYGLGTPSEVLGTTSQSTGETSNIYGTLGSGLNFGVTPGYMLNEHFGMEIGINYFLGTEIIINKYTAGNSQTNTVYRKSNQLRILPNLIFSTGTASRLSGYAKVGLVMPVMGSTFTRVEDTGTGFFGYNREVETKGQFTLGFSGAIGGAYKISDDFSFFAELSGVNMRIKAKSSTVTSNEVAGVDVLNSLTVSDKETVYVDELNVNTPQLATEAKKQLAPKNNFGAVFINIGVKINF